LKYYGYEFSRTSEYQGNYGGKKVYKSRYTIVESKKEPGANENEGGAIDKQPTNDINQQQSKKKVITKLVKTYKVDTVTKNQS